jgi:hypothetical protein
MAKKYDTDVGDVHAPVEDVDVPLMLKVLVIMMLFAVIGFGVYLTMSLAPSLMGQ